MENSMSYVNVVDEIGSLRDYMIEYIDKLDDLSDMYQIGFRDGLRRAVGECNRRIDSLIDDESELIKTAPVPSPEPYRHSYTKKEQNTTEEAVNDDKVNKPNHYVGVKGLEVEEVLQNFLPKYKDPYTSHRVGSAIEYQLRSPEKNGLEDLRKARKNLDQAIEYEESKIEHNDIHSISAGGSSVAEMDIDLNEAMSAFARIGSGSGVSITADNLKLS